MLYVLWLPLMFQAALVVLIGRQLLAKGSFEWALFDAVGIPGLSIRLDGLAFLFILLSSLMAILAGFQISNFFAKQSSIQKRIWWRFWIVLLGLSLVWTAGDLITLYIAMELVAFGVVGLIALGDQAESYRSALRYLKAVLLGTLSFLIGILLIYGIYGTVSLEALQQNIESTVLTGLAFALMTVGLVYRAALFPLHSWLPPAHGSSHAPLSALLSALVTKASFYTLARLWLDWGDLIGSHLLAQLLGVLGALAILWGGWMACRQSELKMLVAYSSVNQVGYFFLLFPLIIGVSNEVALLAKQGVMLQVVSHALAKAALFMAAGNLVAALGSKYIADLSGISRSMPLSLLSFGLAGVSIMGLPPSGGFLAKWYLLQASLLSGQWWWIPVLIIGGLLSATYIFRIFSRSFLEEANTKSIKIIPKVLEIAPMILALLAVGLGLFANAPLALMMIGLEVTNGVE
ncbi:MAG: hydrogenase 4 subunit B [Oceanospirillales bacterium]|nr:MAG: hydrogenase 4 subunit B [Oceanospirillales bacterium]